MSSPSLVPDIQLAPMEGVLDWVLRELLSEVGGLDRMVTEFVRVTDRLLPDHVFRRYSPELDTGGRTRAGVPVFVQLLGGQPGPMAENAARVAALGAPGVDLNFGCPAKTVNRHDGGAALLAVPSRLYDVTRAVRDAVPSGVPVTCKVRLGLEHKDFHREIAEACEAGGGASLVVHARTKREMYQPPAHWDYIARMAVGRSIPFLANGEIWSVEDYRLCCAAAGVSRVALGRGLVRRPVLAREIRGEVDVSFDRVEFLSRFFEWNVSLRGEAFAVARMKQMLRSWATPPVCTASASASAAADDSEALLWFNRVKLFSHAAQAVDFLRELRKDALKCSPPPSPYIPGPTAPTAFAQKIC